MAKKRAVEAKPKKMTVEEAIRYYADKIERGEPSDDKGFLNTMLKAMYHLGDGDFKKGSERMMEIEKKRLEKELDDNPVLALFETLRKSENAIHRMFARFILADGMKFPEEEAKALQNKILEEENQKSAKQLPASIGEKVSKRSRSQYSDEEKLNALRDWSQLSKSKDPITIEDWLRKRFRDKHGLPNVAKSTFYSWKKRFEGKDKK